MNNGKRNFTAGLKLRLFNYQTGINKTSDDLIAKILTGNCSEKEQKQFELWLKGDKKNQAYFNSLKTIWDSKKQDPPCWDENAALSRLKERIAKEANTNPAIPKYNNFTRGFSISSNGALRFAASLLILISALFIYQKLNRTDLNTKPQISLIELSAKIGEIKKIYLHDGSVVTLNSTSKLRYPPQFNKTREVYLEGEAYFDVAHNPAKPFIVHLEIADIKVLGTKFNVKGWQGNKKYQVVVEAGKVSFTSKRGNSNNAEVVLTKNQMSIMETGKLPSNPITANAQMQTAWLDGTILFDKTPLKEVISQLERKFDISITVSNNAFLERLLTASFKNSPVEIIIKTIGRALDLKYTRNGKNIVYSENSSAGNLYYEQ